MQIIIHVKPRKIGLILGSIALFLAIQSLFNEFLIETYIGHSSDSVLALVLDLFSVNLEESIPTWFSTINLFIASGLLGLIALDVYKQQDKYRHHWLGLALMFVYLSMDEGAVIHEILSDPLQILFNTTGFLSFGWQIAAVPLVVIFGLVYLRFLFSLPPHIRNLFIASAVLYAGGALFIEGLSANQWYINDGISLSYLAIATVEELFEMLGVVLFIYTLMTYIVLRGNEYILDTQSVAEGGSTTASSKPKKNHFQRRFLAICFIAIVGLNLVFVRLSTTQAIPSSLIEVDDTAFYQAIIEKYGDNNITITYMSGIFGLESDSLNQVLVSFANLYEEVMVVSLPPIEGSIVFAGDVLPFDRNEMSTILLEKGETQFIIFETELVKTILAR